MLANLLLLLGCAGAGPSEESPAEDTGGTGELSPPGVCAQYLACAEETDPLAGAALVAAYGPEGTCWSGDAALWEACASSCEDELARARALAPVAQGCGDGTSGDSSF